ncbi:MAG: GNAT family N-acetyltransferase [Ekhidna sp.]
MIRAARQEDTVAITSIYNHYIKSSHVTFELTPIDEDEMWSRIKQVQSVFQLPWLVSEENGLIVGYAYATRWKQREAYRKTTEISIYMRPDSQRRGLGLPLYKSLIDQLQSLNYHTVIGGVSLPNDASIRLHEKLGFEKVAHFKEQGYKFDRWIDVGYWQLMLS